MRIQFLTAACAAALLATPALAQDMTPPPEPTNPPVTSPVDAPTQPEAPAPTPPQAMTQPEPTTPQATTTETPATAQTADATMAEDIVDVLRADGQFTTLVSALDASGLTSTLESDASITILAPTDAAFAALPAGEVERLMAEENREELRQLLLYHVINADVRREQLDNRRGAVETGSGAQIMLDGGNGMLMADAATITNAELRGSNGAVLVVDQVLNPATSLAGQGDVEAPATDATIETSAEAEATEGAEMPATPPTDTEPAEAQDPMDDADPTTPQA